MIVTHGQSINKKKSALFLFSLLLIIQSFAQAEQIKNQLNITVYNEDLALIEDRREINLQKGKNHLEFLNVSPLIRPETVSLNAKSMIVLEQNFDFDLLTPEKLMEKAVNQKVKIVRINPGNGSQVTETAKVLSVNQGVVLEVNGQIEVLRADSIPTRVIFDKIPDNLRSKPTLSVDVESEKSGLEIVTLSYLSRGLTWKADYVALFDEKKGTLDLQGWLTLDNKTGISFSDVNLQMVAGGIYLSDNQSEFEKYYKSKNRKSIQYTSEKNGTEFSDYYLYKIPTKTTIENNQSKQISFMDLSSIKSEKAYHFSAYDFYSSDNSEPVEVGLKFSNTQATGAGFPLPAGIMRVYINDARGNPTFIGEDSINHSPAGSDLYVKTGEAFDVIIKPKRISEEKNGKHTRYDMEYEIYNARDKAIQVAVQQEANENIEKITNENIKSQRIDANTMLWMVPVKEKETFVLKFTALVENLGK